MWLVILSVLYANISQYFGCDSWASCSGGFVITEMLLIKVLVPLQMVRLVIMMLMFKFFLMCLLVAHMSA